MKYDFNICNGLYRLVLEMENIFMKSTLAEYMPVNDKTSSICSHIDKKKTQNGVLLSSLIIYDTDMLFILRCKLVRTNIEDVSAFGVDMMAYLVVGLWRD